MLLFRAKLCFWAKKAQCSAKIALSKEILQTVESANLFSYLRWQSGNISGNKFVLNSPVRPLSISLSFRAAILLQWTKPTHSTLSNCPWTPSVVVVHCANDCGHSKEWNRREREEPVTLWHVRSLVEREDRTRPTLPPLWLNVNGAGRRTSFGAKLELLFYFEVIAMAVCQCNVVHTLVCNFYVKRFWDISLAGGPIL